jgi:two-component system KDP operon response regulator KdpE
VALEGLVQQLEPDVILLEPPNDKRQIVQTSETVRSYTDRPIVVLSSQNDELVITRAFAAGIDEYLPLPIGARELGARIDAMLRRVQRTAPQHDAVGVEGLVLSASDLSVACRGTKIVLSPIEFRLLSCLASAAGQVVTHDALMLRVWGPEYVDSRHYLHLYVRYLREKLEEDPSNPKIILSEWGVGYRIQSPGAQAEAR